MRSDSTRLVIFFNLITNNLESLLFKPLLNFVHLGSEIVFSSKNVAYD